MIIMGVDFSIEKKIWRKGYRVIAGCDEVGRGSLAGPVVCGCVCFDKEIVDRFVNKKGIWLMESQTGLKETVRIDDSKKLTKLQRKVAARWIKSNCLTWGVGVSGVAEINKKGITRATLSGFRRAVANAQNKLASRINFLIIDAFYIPRTRGFRTPRKSAKKANRDAASARDLKISANQLAVVDADEKSFSVAAASIIAKVYRDTLMERLSKVLAYKYYHWEKNKGYGTREHILAIKKHGASRLHREKFVGRFIV